MWSKTKQKLIRHFPSSQVVKEFIRIGVSVYIAGGDGKAWLYNSMLQQAIATNSSLIMAG